MDEAGGLSIWPILGIAVVAALAGWDLAKRKGLNKRSWAATCFFFAPALIALAFTKAQHRPGETKDFRDRWVSLAAYDPDIKAALERMAALGPRAVEQFRLSYADVQTKEAIPIIATDIERQWAAGDRFDGVHHRAQKLDELRRQGRLSDRDYEEQRQRLDGATSPRSRWSRWWWRVPVGLVGLWLIVSLLAPSGPSGFPTCEASTTRDMLRQAIEQGEDSKIRNTRLIALDEVQELSYDPKTPERYCIGLAALNSGEQRLAWRLYRRGRNLFVQVIGS